MAEVYYSPSMVVHLKKQGGNIIHNCNICISNGIKNSSWELEESKWCDPFHKRWDLTLKERWKKYRDYVTSKPELMRSLSELRGKMLGCLCQSPHSCRSHVLVELVRRAFSREEDYCTKASKAPQQRKLQKKFRLGSFQLFYWQKAVNTWVLKIAHAIWKVKSMKKVRQCSKKIPIVETPLSNQILSMHRILSLK